MNETIDATNIFAPLWRRKWLILSVAILVGVGAYVYYKGKPSVFQASTVLYLGAAEEEAAPGEKSSAKPQSVNAQAQAQLINTIVVEQTRKQLRQEHHATLAHTKIRVKGAEKGAFITITTEAATAGGAALVANLVAVNYIARQRAEHQRVVERAISIARRQLRRIEAANTAKTQAAAKGKGAAAPSTSSILQAANLNSKINQLESSLGQTGAQQVKVAKAGTAVKTAPQPRKSAIFGFVLGLVLTSIAAYILSRFDRRLRTLRGAEQVFGAPILAALPRVRRPIVYRDGLPSPSRNLLDPLQRLYTGLRLSDTNDGVPGAPSVLLVMSADPGDGKSTLVADLALVKRDAGERVAVVEANFRRPVQARLLGLDGAPGLADVLSGKLPLGEAMGRVLPLERALELDTDAEGPAVATAVQASAGALFLLAGGGAVPNPPAALAQPAMKELLRTLAADYDSVLVDAPSPLEAPDVMPLLREVGGIVIVARAGHTRETSAHRLVELLGQTPSAPVIGVAFNCVTSKDLERYGFSSYDGRGRGPRLRRR